MKENIGKSFQDIDFHDAFEDLTPKAKGTNKHTNKRITSN